MASDERTLPALEFVSSSAEATAALGEVLGQLAHPDLVVALDGELGSGKTCLVRGLARGLAIVGPVASPTYTLMATYAGRLELYHYDAWMEGREKALFSDGGDEWLCAGGVAVVEWAERVAEWLPERRLAVQLTHVDPEHRALRVSATGVTPDPPDPLERLLHGLAAAAAEIEGLERIEGEG